MKQLTRIFSIILSLLILLSSCVLIVQAQNSPNTGQVFITKVPTQEQKIVNQEKALAFIENVLPFDTTKYNIETTHTISSTVCLLESKDSKIKITVAFQDDVITSVGVPTYEGTVSYKEVYSNAIDTTKSLLQKYQAHTSMDSSKLIETLSKVETIEEKTTVIVDDVKLTISRVDNPISVMYGTINFHWVQIINGCDYSLFRIIFRNDALYSLMESRGTYTIGDTSVKISRGEAIKIALKATENFSYNTRDNVWVTDFEIQDQIYMNLGSTIKETNILYPAWILVLPLKEGGDIIVTIWAGTGEIQNIQYAESIISDTLIYSGMEEVTLTNSNTMFLIIAAILITIITVAIITLTIKKKTHIKKEKLINFYSNILL